MTTVIRFLLSLSSPRPWTAIEIILLPFSFFCLRHASFSVGRIFDRLHAILETLKLLVFGLIVIVGKAHYSSAIRYLIVCMYFVDRAQIINAIVLLWLRKLLFVAFGVMMDWLYFIIVRNC